MLKWLVKMSIESENEDMEDKEEEKEVLLMLSTFTAATSQLIMQLEKDTSFLR